MARPSSTPRLRELSPQDLGAEVERLVQDQIATQLLRIGMSAAPPKYQGPSALRWSIQLLVGYAQIGLSATDWPDHDCAEDGILSVCEALYSCAGEPGTFGGGALENSSLDPTKPIDIVLLAAHARVLLSERQRIPVRELACLAGVDPDHVRLLARKGELTLENGAIKAGEAKRWLVARGIAGLA